MPLGYDWTKDVQKTQPYNNWDQNFINQTAEAYGSDNVLGPLANIYNDPGKMTELLLRNPNIQASLQAGNDAAAAARRAATAGLGAARDALNKARAAAAKQRDIQRKQLDFKLNTELRDIEQGRESGLEGAINNALQRGIYRSGIRIENENEVNRESDEAASDLRTNIDLALQMIQAQGEGQEAGFDSQAASLARQSAMARAQSMASQQFITLDDVAQIATQFQFNPISTAQAPPKIQSPTTGTQPKTVQPINPADQKYFGGVQ